MEFISELLAVEWPFRVLNAVVDVYHEGLAVEVNISRLALHLICTPERIIEWRGKPDTIRGENGLEHVSATLQLRTQIQTIAIPVHSTGKTTEQCLCETLPLLRTQ